MSQTAPKIVISHNDRLGLTLFLAITLHALVILGISFSSEDAIKPESAITMDITLVQHKSDKKNEKADYLAQANQEGGGNTQQKVRHQAVQSKPSPEVTSGQADQNATAVKKRQPKKANVKVLTAKQAEKKVIAKNKEPKKIKVGKVSTQELVRRSKEIARLSAQNDASWQAYSKLPDSKYLYANTRRAVDAAYLASWARKVREIGEMNYPYEARRKNLSGMLMMEVTLRPDGSLVSINILKSSGHKVLDKSAIAIVKMSSPFSQVPPEVLEDRKELRIIRTLSFTVNNKLYSR